MFTRESSVPVGFLSAIPPHPQHSGVLGANVAFVFPSTCVVSRVPGTCLISAIPSMAWPPVQQKFSAEVVGWDMESRGAGAVGGCWVGFKEC